MKWVSQVGFQEEVIKITGIFRVRGSRQGRCESVCVCLCNGKKEQSQLCVYVRLCIAGIRNRMCTDTEAE
jgi:hypothetical protein